MRTSVAAACGVVVTCFLFVLIVFQSDIVVFKNNLLPDTVPCSQIHQGIGSNVIAKCNNSILLSDYELGRVDECVTGFKAFRHQRIDSGDMEHKRVNIHSYLNADSLVLEVGGYTGMDAGRLIAKYNPNYLAIEPIPKYYRILENKYKDNPKFKVLKFGLGKEDKTLYINVDSDATSLFRKKKVSSKTKQEEAHIHEITKFFDGLNVKNKPIDLISINCEGCEYELLYLLISSGIVKHLKNIQFQFHLDLPGIANQECRYCSIMTLLSRTHRPRFQYSFTWQCWRLISEQ